jgi:hypothetical protein
MLHNANFSQAVINSGINLRAESRVNFYQWLKDTHYQFRPEISIFSFYMLICLACSTEKECYNQIPIN